MSVRLLQLAPHDLPFSLERYTAAYSAVRSAFLVLTVTAFFLLFLKTLLLLFRHMTGKVGAWKGTLIRPVRVHSVELLSEERIAALGITALAALRLELMLGLLYGYLMLMFSFFEATRSWAGTLAGYLLAPVRTVLGSVIDFLPNLFYIAVIAAFAYYLVKLLRFFFTELDKGTFILPGFYPEWAVPTFKLVRVLVAFFALIVIFPYIPGSDSPGFKGLSVFLGLLLSLCLSTAITNIIAGVAITYMRPFKVGDWVK